MSTNPTSPPARQGLGSLYADLLDPSTTVKSTSSASISRAPVVFKQNDEELRRDNASAPKQNINPAALRFQPTKRPQLSAQKPKGKPTILKSSHAGPTPTATSSTTPPTANSTTGTTRPPVKNTLADWAAAGADEDVNGFYGGEKRQRGGRRKRKKNKEDEIVPQNWDDIYDPSRPNSYEEYKNSDEKIREVREWKDRLYAHRMARRHSSDMETDDERQAPSKMNSHFAPPPNYSFAPPQGSGQENDTGSSPPPPPPPAEIPDDQTGDEAYLRRLRLSQAQQVGTSNLIPSSAPQLDQPSAPSIPQAPISSPPPPPPPEPKAPPAATISRAPVRYNLPRAPANMPATEAELEAAFQNEASADVPTEGQAAETEPEPRSLRPGQKGFAERLMSKYGWTKGSGLGASGSGIVNPLRVQIEKQKKKSDAEGGGFVGPGGRGKIVGGNKKRKTDAGEEADAEEEGMFGKMSEVVLLRGMVDGMDLDAEMQGSSGDGGGLMQEIGEECAEKYGRVERVFIHKGEPEAGADQSGPKVFVKFTSQLSALRAVNALQGRVFNGNAISARFFDVDKFEAGDYS